MTSKFRDLVTDNSRPLLVLGTVPPRKSFKPETCERIAKAVAEDAVKGNVSAVAIYDIQNEQGRVDGPRPYAFAESWEGTDYLVLLRKYLPETIECIIYRALPYHPEDGESLEPFLAKIAHQNCHSIVYVGGSSSYAGISVESAVAFTNASSSTFVIGGITLPERHVSTSAEHKLLAGKAEKGASFFTSQVVYNADSVICLLRDYSDLCKKTGCQPARIILTFAPFGRKETLEFLRWLGVEVPNGTAHRILSRGDSSACVAEAVYVCRENLRRILDACVCFDVSVPLGVTAEGVSKHPEELAAVKHVIDLLSDELERYYAKRRLRRNNSNLQLSVSK